VDEYVDPAPGEVGVSPIAVPAVAEIELSPPPPPPPPPDAVSVSEDDILRLAGSLRLAAIDPPLLLDNGPTFCLGAEELNAA
jgi:hypothetical protein